MGLIGDYFSWATGLVGWGDGAIGAWLLGALFVLVVPAFTLLLVAIAFVEVLAGVKSMGRQAAAGFRHSRSDR